MVDVTSRMQCTCELCKEKKWFLFYDFKNGQNNKRKVNDGVNYAYFDESSCYRCVLCFSIGWCLQSTFYESEIIQLNQVQSQKKWND